MTGLYIHIPFCRQACTYCDFHFSTSLKNVEAMIDAINKEIILQKNYSGEKNIDTIYFGGGTPSLLKKELLDSILKTIRENFDVDSNAEITLEANPDDLTNENCSALFDVGINRLSIGIQSFDDEDLNFMNRAHDSKQALECVANAKRAGFTNISVDLIYGLPGKGIEGWKKNLDKALELDVDHLSCYSLTIEPKTVLAKMVKEEKVHMPPDEKSITEFAWLISRSAEAGFEHYEISNFARNKKYSRHNTSYWQGKKYIGIGPSAHSFDGESRQWNISNNQEYIRSIEEGKVPFEKEILTVENKFNEYILTTLRTMWGIDIDKVEREFGKEQKNKLLEELVTFEDQMLVIRTGNNYTLTKQGKFLADRIASELFI